MPSKNELLRSIPQVDDILSHPALLDAAGKTSRALAADAARAALDKLREDILGDRLDEPPGRDGIADLIVSRLKRDTTPSLRRVINATGVVLHTNLGRAPLSKSAVEAVKSAAEGYSTLEYDVESGERGSRHSHVEKLLTRLTGAEDAMAVNNNAAAVLLALSALARGREVIVSRGELVEIGGAFRIPDVMEQSGCVLREVGTTNRTRASDYENAVSESTGALFKAHTSNYKILGFTEEVSAGELASLGKRCGKPVIHDLGSGSLMPGNGLAVLDEPYVTESVEAGADVICFSGDKLFGGPQAGIIIGKGEYIAKMKKHPLARALRIDKLTLAALEGTLRLYLDAELARREVPVLRMISDAPGVLREKAGRLAALIDTAAARVGVTDAEGQAGGGSAPAKTLPSSAVELLPESMTVTVLEEKLRMCEVPVVARIAHDRLLLDVRTIDESDFDYIAACLNSILGGGGV